MAPEHSTAPIALREPRPLPDGARVALVAPSGPLEGPHEVERAIATAESLGWLPSVGQHALTCTGYFAGDDTARGDDLLAALLDPAVDAIWCLRGGYGAARLLPRLPRALLQQQAKVLIGFSDITALHAAWQDAGLISYHGPVARAVLTPWSREHLVRAVVSQEDSAGVAPEATTVRSGRVHGRLAGGNLALLASLCGTPWAVSFRGAIAVLEDVGEATYRLDRMLVQLRLAGAFDGCVGIAFGHCTDCPDTSADGSRGVGVIVRELADVLQLPTLAGIPIGHIADQWTLPFGAMATLDTDRKTLHVHRHS